MSSPTKQETPKPAHVAVMPIAAWGHVRPMLHLAINLITVHPNLHLSLLLAPSVTPRVAQELKSSWFRHVHVASAEGETRSINDRIQILPVSDTDLVVEEIDFAKFGFEDINQEAITYAAQLPNFVQPLLTGAREINSKLVNKFDGIPLGFGIFDMFTSSVPAAMQKLSEEMKMEPIPLLSFGPTNAAAQYNSFSSNGHVTRMVELAQPLIDGGMDSGEALVQFVKPSEGRVVEIPGLGKKFDYEWRPHVGAFPMPPSSAIMLAESLKGLRHPLTTAMILPTTQEFEEETVAATIKDIGKPLIMAGIQFPDSVWQGVKQDQSFFSQDDRDVMSFLDKMEDKHGKHSVVYVSLGSFFFPLTRPEILTFVLDSLVENNVPLLFAYASPFAATLGQEVFDKISAYEDGHAVKFAPQWAVFEHPATGFFVSHCGSNSTAEAIMSELPVVCLPFAADQGEFAELLVEKLKVALPIYQTYTPRPPPPNATLPEGPLTLYNGTKIIGTEEAIKAELKEIWAKLRGEEGKVMRENMRGVRAAMKASWEGGKSREAMVGLKKYF